MRAVVIGGTGRIGKRVVTLLAAEGHDVLAVNRRGERAGVVLAAVAARTDVCDARDPVRVAEVVAGADAVVLATAPTREHPDDLLVQTAHVRDAAQAGGVRLVVVTHHKALRAPDGRPMLEADPPHPYFAPLEAVFADQVACLRGVGDLDWLAIAPAADLFPYGEVTRAWRVESETLVTTDPSTAFPEESRLSMEDLAAVVVEETVRPTRRQELIGVGY